jgi:hypothetical protein
VGPIQVLRTNQVENIAHKAKQEAFGDWTTLIKTHPYCNTVEPTPRPFLLFDLTNRKGTDFQ